ncbi:MAG: hypothetical protein DI637_03695 [Citromicrobium sp.]|nr:MAG: hypothetical protein DI637_03695 [Citromicrobium sp.]
MATNAVPSHSRNRITIGGEHRFFLIASWLLACLTVAGFALHVVAGISSFDRPLVYHLHAVVFMGFIGLYLTQVTLAALGHVSLHRRLGLLAALWVPLMLALGCWLTIATLRITGGPPIFGQSEFLLLNLCHLAAFGGLAFAALKMRDRPDWHKRLMFGAIATVSLPGIARLIPPTLTMPYAIPKLFLLVSLFPLAGMVMDRRVNGRIHPAWWWSLLLPPVAVLFGELLDTWGVASEWVASHVAGTPGGQRPSEAFMPPGMGT